MRKHRVYGLRPGSWDPWQSPRRWDGTTTPPSRSSSSDEKGVSQESQELQFWEDVKQPVYDLGSTAAMCQVHRPHTPGVLTRQEIVLAPTLCIRGSSRSRMHALPT